MKQEVLKEQGKRSIFRSLFIPLFLIMILQALLFYLFAVYGGIEDSLRQNAEDILAERLTNRKNEIETLFVNKWSDLDLCAQSLDDLYAAYEQRNGAFPFTKGKDLQVQFLKNSQNALIGMLRRNEVNGVFLILNDRSAMTSFPASGSEQRYGLCIRDMDQNSSYSDVEDLLLERAPSSIIDTFGCSLDSWWEARYAFTSEEGGDFYYNPLNAAWQNPGVQGSDLAYFAGAYQLSGSDQPMAAYSIPLLSQSGAPYGVLGVELSTKYLATLLPNKELNDADKCCYLLAFRDVNTDECVPVVGSGSLYSRCFGSASVIKRPEHPDRDDFSMTTRGNVSLYGQSIELTVYNNNSPFENRQLTLIAFVESNTLFAHIDHIKQTLLFVSLISLVIGVIGILLVSRHFASPITTLARRVRTAKPQPGFQLDRLGITEIDQLVDSIETLSQNVSRDIARTEFFSRMSHDMRTPMNAIISFSSPELLDGASERTKDEYLQKIHTSGDYLLGLINEVLDITKIESNKVELHCEPVQALKLWDTTLSIIEKLAQKKNVRFVHDLTIAPDLYVQVDEQHLNQIVINLLSNAVKFTATDGTVELTVRMTEGLDDPARAECQITVKDNGVGMSEEFMNHLYTPFEQENSSQEGTGLGLSISKKLVELMGGSIQCSSQKNIGTTFWVNLSFARCAAPKAAEAGDAKRSAAQAAPALQGKRVLVCEDQPLNTQIICKLLERMKISVQTAPNGKLGVEAFAASPPSSFDAVLMDIRMPVMDGLEATRALRALDREDARTVPVIAMTANAFEEDRRASKEAGMNAHLSKPINPGLLYETLEALLQKAAS